MRIAVISGLLFSVSLVGVAPAQESATAIPDWFTSYMETEVGTWITDNSAYMSENESWEQYGLDWDWGLGKTSLVGSLYGIREGQANAEFWQFRVYWHPGEREARMEQWGHGGNLLSGWIRQAGQEDGKPVFEAEQTLHAPSGQTMKVRHRSVQGEDVRFDQSFNWQDGGWQPRRQYTWHRVQP